ncbi:MAG: hypothetical protein ACTHJR_19330 [Sphingomonas sp.]|uniref:hypothetical protein n=1 Tax=Sphingomonas sp. TaxID=28214 RepID=UPI003F7F2D1A
MAARSSLKLLCLALLTLFAAVPAAAQEELQDGPKSLVISYRASLEHRAAFRRYLATDLAPRLRAMKARGELADFRIFYSWYRQPAVWDGLVILRFPTFQAVTKWNALERSEPGGLDAAGIALADPVASYSSDLSWSRNPDDLKDGEVYYVIPYEYRNEGEYRDYVKGYVLPQFDGWIETGALDGYEIYMNRYGTGSPWDSLFIQHYRNMAAFGQRQKITASVRDKLRNDPKWKEWSDKKAGIRSESENSIAELIAH